MKVVAFPFEYVVLYVYRWNSIQSFNMQCVTMRVMNATDATISSLSLQCCRRTTRCRSKVHLHCWLLDNVFLSVDFVHSCQRAAFAFGTFARTQQNTFI